MASGSTAQPVIFVNFHEPQTTAVLAPFPQALSSSSPPADDHRLGGLRTHKDLNVVEAVAELLSHAVSVNNPVDTAAARLATRRSSAPRFFRLAGDETAAQVLVDFLGQIMRPTEPRAAALTCLGAMRSP